MARIPTAEAAFSSACFGGFLPQPAYFTGALRPRAVNFLNIQIDDLRRGAEQIRNLIPSLLELNCRWRVCWRFRLLRLLLTTLRVLWLILLRGILRVYFKEFAY